jgi:hypothetical protein
MLEWLTRQWAIAPSGRSIGEGSGQGAPGGLV